MIETEILVTLPYVSFRHADTHGESRTSEGLAQICAESDQRQSQHSHAVADTAARVTSSTWCWRRRWEWWWWWSPAAAPPKHRRCAHTQTCHRYTCFTCTLCSLPDVNLHINLHVCVCVL